MLSYRHAFHAGNHADVLKHIILLQIAEYMAEKPAPFWIIDTHAGAGGYLLKGKDAQKKAAALQQQLTDARTEAARETGIGFDRYPDVCPWTSAEILSSDWLPSN